MKIDIITLFPAIFENAFEESILGAACKKGTLEIHFENLRPYGEGRHKVVDDTAFGGGPGMILKPGPLDACIDFLRKKGQPAPVISLSPQGLPFDNDIAADLAKFERLIFVCGRYEGFDERISKEFDLQLSVGDYVLTGGEFPAMIVIDAISRMIPGTVGCRESVESDSFFNGILDHPQYTKPSAWQGSKVPGILLEGNHKYIELWRRSMALLTTSIKRPALFGTLDVSEADKQCFQAAVHNDEPVYMV